MKHNRGSISAALDIACCTCIEYRYVSCPIEVLNKILITDTGHKMLTGVIKSVTKRLQLYSNITAMCCAWGPVSSSGGLFREIRNKKFILLNFVTIVSRNTAKFCRQSFVGHFFVRFDLKRDQDLVVLFNYFRIHPSIRSTFLCCPI
jgi:hypothetical protein